MDWFSKFLLFLTVAWVGIIIIVKLAFNALAPE